MNRLLHRIWKHRGFILLVLLILRLSSSSCNALLLYALTREALARVVDPNNKTVWDVDKAYILPNCLNVAAKHKNRNVSVTNTTFQAIYQSERSFRTWDAKAQAPFGYEIPVPTSGRYKIRVQFAEISKLAAIFRTFGLEIDGTVEFSAMNLLTQTGFVASYVYEKEIQITTGSVRIVLAPGIYTPKVSAVELLAVQPAPTAPIPAPTASLPPAPTTAPVPAPVPAPVSAPVSAPAPTATVPGPVRAAAPMAPVPPAPITAPVPAPAPIVTPAVIVVPIRINTGGGPASYLDSKEQLWNPDSFSFGAKDKLDCTVEKPIAATQDDDLF